MALAAADHESSALMAGIEKGVTDVQAGDKADGEKYAQELAAKNEQLQKEVGSSSRLLLTCAPTAC